MGEQGRGVGRVRDGSGARGGGRGRGVDRGGGRDSSGGRGGGGRGGGGRGGGGRGAGGRGTQVAARGTAEPTLPAVAAAPPPPATAVANKQRPELTAKGDTDGANVAGGSSKRRRVLSQPPPAERAQEGLHMERPDVKHKAQTDGEVLPPPLKKKKKQTTTAEAIDGRAAPLAAGSGAAATAAAAAAKVAAAAAKGAAAAAKANALKAASSALMAVDGGAGAARLPRGAINSNWDALRRVVAAMKKPPPPEHVQRRRQKAKAAAAEAGGGGGRRPGLVGTDTGLTKVLALDCEMVGVGPKGSASALARVCIVNSAGAVLLDTFVQPKEKVTDYRTWVSGVRPSDLADGQLYDDVIEEVGRMVKGRILVGHAIGNDLRALRLEEHPRSLVRDTSKYPGLMKELPGGRKVSTSLKDLATTHLGLTIQEGEHTPVDDARAALYLYQKFHREWEAAIRSGQLMPVIGGLGRKKQRERKGGLREHRNAGKGGDKERGLHGVAAGGVRKERRAGKAGKGQAQQHKGKAGAAALWSLERDPYADL